MNMVPVTSSNIQSIGWEASILRVAFLNGSIYEYEGVPESVYEQMLAAPSVGQFLHREIKPNYPFEKVQ